MTPDWPFHSSEGTLKTELKNCDSNEVNTEPAYQQATANTPSVASSVITLDGKMYISYEKLFAHCRKIQSLRIVAYIVRISLKF